MGFMVAQRHVARRTASSLSLLSLAFATLLVAVGCDRTAETEVAEIDSATPSVPSVEAVEAKPAITVDPADASSGLEATPTVPATPLVPPKQADTPPAAPPPQTLGIGDPSPGIKIAKWVKGEPVEQTLAGKVHVVEFWATWCGPCRVGMPHISELQTEYGDEVAFIGVTREDEATVTGFLEKESPSGETWDEVIKYRLALDDGDWTNTAYMRAAGQNGIPCAFVVGRDGVVEWIGHPARIDEPLKEIVDGNWDREAAIAEFKAQQRMKEAMGQLSQMLRTQDWDGALELVDQMEQELGDAANVNLYRLTILERAGRIEEATAVREQVIDAAWDEPQMLNQIAWNTARMAQGNEADLQLALKAATRASELRENKDAAVLDTVARVHYVMGNLDEAIKWQQLAVENNSGLAQIDATLDSYLKEKAAAEAPAADDSPAEAETPGEAASEETTDDESAE